MPQISKIRIVNFTYNDGNRFIPDELYDLSSPESGEALNTLFNMNNGGGKTVLVQLMMQPVHPKAMAGGRHIEDYFAHSGEHSFILLEWNLDESRDKLLTGIAIAASASNSSEDNQRGNQVKYYTFKTTYENRSPYSIASLDLSKNDNGKFVPAPFDFVREKSKASKGILEYYSSDDSVKWAEMLSEEYGIHRAEWESVIETLNKDEGGLNQYFDDAKTSDKLIAKFFIPAIEQKLTSAASRGADSSLETMLINYARKITDKEMVIQEKETNSQLLTELTAVKDMVVDLYMADDELTHKISEAWGFKSALSRRIAALEAEIEAVSQSIDRQNELIGHIEYEKKSKAYYVAQNQYTLEKAAFEEVSAILDQCKKDLDFKRHEEDILQCTRLYRQIQEAEARSKELKRMIEDKENHSEDAERIASLKYSVFLKAKDTEKSQKDKASALAAGIESETKSLRISESKRKEAEEGLNNAKEKYSTADAAVNAAKNNTDKRVQTLHMDLIRKFDGFYSGEEMESVKAQKLQLKKKLDLDVRKTEKRMKEIEERQIEIPDEKALITIKKKENADSTSKAEQEREVYDTLHESLVKICDKYSLDSSAMFSAVLHQAVQKEIDFTDAGITAVKHERQVLEEKRNAAGEGCLHIIPEVMKYVRSTGISCRSGEEYLCGLIEDGKLSDKKSEKILSGYPELAYSLLFTTEKDLQRILSAGNIDWLPAAVPLFTMEQVERIFDGEMDSSAFLAVCDRKYFSDRNGYIDQIVEKINGLDDRTVYLEEHLSEAKEELGMINRFDYPAEWKEEQEARIRSLKQEGQDLLTALHRLDAEAQTLKKQLDECDEELNRNKKEIQRIVSWLDSFNELESMLVDETGLSYERQEAYIARERAARDYDKACTDYKHCSESLARLQSEQKDNNASLDQTRSIIAKVDNAAESAVIEDDLTSLCQQYDTLLSSLHESLEGIRNNLRSEQEKKSGAEKELAAYDCEEAEYTDTTFSPDQLQKVKKELHDMEKSRDSIQKEYNEKNSRCSSAEADYKQALQALADYQGIPLPQGEIGESFDERIRNARNALKTFTDQVFTLGEKKRSLERVSDQVGDSLEDYPAGTVLPEIILTAEPDMQWKKIRTGLTDCKNVYATKKAGLNDRVRNTIAAYSGNVLVEIVGKLDSVREMLEDFRIKGDRLHTASESISMMIESIEKINRKIETDLKEIENDFNDIVNQCFIQGKRIYTDLRMIANSSRAHLYDGKPQTQMVRMDLPGEKEIAEEASRLSIRLEIEQGANEIKELIKSGVEDKLITRRAKTIVGSERLLHKYIRKESICVRVYKIDLNSANSTYKKWENALTQSSGAEKFVAFFSVVLTLMNYTRSSSGLISRSAKSVLILDNPFGKITSAHLLKPMFDIARHFNVQLICLSDINKSDVISCFDCVIKLLIRTQNLSSFEIMTHEGNERIEHGYYKMMNGQLSLNL